MVDTARAKLITVIASFELQDRLEHDLPGLGATGFSLCKVDGRGKHGRRRRGVLDGGNIRFETVVAPAAAEAIMAYLAQLAEGGEMVAFCQDVDALPRKHFV
jgi:hypothetical protein